MPWNKKNGSLPAVEVVPGYYLPKWKLNNRCETCALADSRPDLFSDLNNRLAQGDSLNEVLEYACSKDAGISRGSLQRHRDHILPLIEQAIDERQLLTHMKSEVSENDPYRSFLAFRAMVADRALLQFNRTLGSNRHAMEELSLKELLRIGISASRVYLPAQMPQPQPTFSNGPNFEAIIDKFTDEEYAEVEAYLDELDALEARQQADAGSSSGSKEPCVPQHDATNVARQEPRPPIAEPRPPIADGQDSSSEHPQFNR